MDNVGQRLPTLVILVTRKGPSIRSQLQSRSHEYCTGKLMMFSMKRVILLCLFLLICSPWSEQSFTISGWLGKGVVEDKQWSCYHECRLWHVPEQFKFLKICSVFFHGYMRRREMRSVIFSICRQWTALHKMTFMDITWM